MCSDVLLYSNTDALQEKHTLRAELLKSTIQNTVNTMLQGADVSAACG